MRSRPPVQHTPARHLFFLCVYLVVRVLRVFLDERGGVAKEPAKPKTPSRYHQSSSPSPTAAVPTSSDLAITQTSTMETYQVVEKDIQVSSDAQTSSSNDNNINNDSDCTTTPTAPPTSALRTVAVSLSGGVDSMSLCRALVHLRPMYGFDVMGIHIDYGNRHESGREADYVEGWCARHGVIFYKRAIAEVRLGGGGVRGVKYDCSGVCADSYCYQAHVHSVFVGVHCGVRSRLIIFFRMCAWGTFFLL